MSDGHTDHPIKFSSFRKTLYSLKLVWIAKMIVGMAKMEGEKPTTGRREALSSHPALHFPLAPAQPSVISREEFGWHDHCIERINVKVMKPPSLFAWLIIGIIGLVVLAGYYLPEKLIKRICLAWLTFNIGWYIYYFPNYD